MHPLTRLIADDMRPALGVTEPGAIAFAVATARDHVTGTLRELRLTLNSGMFKNAFTCGIPNSREVGNEHAVALGYVAADASRGLECLDNVSPRHNALAKKLVADGKIHVAMGEVTSRIYICAEIVTDAGSSAVTIRDSHTHITEIRENGNVVFTADEKKADSVADAVPTIHRYTLRQMLHYAKNVPLDEIRFIARAYEVNLALFDLALSSRRTVFAHKLLEQNGRLTISSDERLSASLLCNAAIEARVLGLSRPAMSVTGSGAHGIIATLPLYAVQQVNGLDDETLLRATALSYLVCMYIKEYSGKLSAFCGCAIAAGTGMACGIVLMKGGGLKALDMTIRNMASGITGMICDGGNHGCTMKGIVAVDAAFRAADFALNGIAIGQEHGINGSTAEDTMRNMGLIASPGMVQTEGIIVDVMRKKK
ncbi:MAG: L-serine ammonia-lyase, iron-sulfur-dependent, subunit alpha [Bacteroidales bacterium]|nr:L-serine ammonia-lyase, iron-sulfur-dependent, subunit alpha [Bacteroidales bacterium]